MPYLQEKGTHKSKIPPEITGKFSVPSKPKQAEAKQNKSFEKTKKNSRIKFVDTQGSSSESEEPEDVEFS